MKANNNEPIRDNVPEDIRNINKGQRYSVSGRQYIRHFRGFSIANARDDDTGIEYYYYYPHTEWVSNIHCGYHVTGILPCDCRELELSFLKAWNENYGDALYYDFISMKDARALACAVLGLL